MLSAQPDPAKPILATRLPPEGIDFAAQMRRVRDELGIGVYRQLWQIARLRYGPSRLHPAEYYRFGLYRRELTWEQRRAFLGIGANRALRRRLNPLDFENYDALFNDKLFSPLLFGALGAPVPKNHAIFAGQGPIPGLRSLPDADAIAGFLGARHTPPLFGKPLKGSRSMGVVAISGHKGDGGDAVLTLTDGRNVAAHALAEEIVRLYPDGYLFDELLASHPTLAGAHEGAPPLTLRIETVAGPEGAQALYALAKVGEVGRMAFGGPLGGLPLPVALEDGRIEPVPDQPDHPLTGQRVPDWPDTLRIATDLHGQFTGYGVIGWDILVSDRGPVLIEANALAMHVGFQLARREGYLNPEFRARLKTAQQVIDARRAAAAARERRNRTIGLMRRV